MNDNNAQATATTTNASTPTKEELVNAYINRCAQDPEEMKKMVGMINEIAKKETKKRIVVKTITYVAIGAALLAAGYFAGKVVPGAPVVPVDPAV